MRAVEDGGPVSTRSTGLTRPHPRSGVVETVIASADYGTCVCVYVAPSCRSARTHPCRCGFREVCGADEATCGTEGVKVTPAQ